MENIESISDAEHEKPAEPQPSKRPPWLIPVLGLLTVLIVWLLSDALIYNPKLFHAASDKERFSNELATLKFAIWEAKITPDGAQARLDSLVRKYPRAVNGMEVMRIQKQIDFARKEFPNLPDSARTPHEWPLILSMPPPKQGR